MEIKTIIAILCIAFGVLYFTILRTKLNVKRISYVDPNVPRVWSNKWFPIIASIYLLLLMTKSIIDNQSYTSSMIFLKLLFILATLIASIFLWSPKPSRYLFAKGIVVIILILKVASFGTFLLEGKLFTTTANLIIDIIDLFLIFAIVQGFSRYNYAKTNKSTD